MERHGQKAFNHTVGLECLAEVLTLQKMMKRVFYFVLRNNGTTGDYVGGVRLTGKGKSGEEACWWGRRQLRSGETNTSFKYCLSNNGKIQAVRKIYREQPQETVSIEQLPTWLRSTALEFRMCAFEFQQPA